MYSYKVKTPVVLIMFKRKKTTLKIIEQIKKVRPDRMYLLSDYGRTPEEILRVEETRKAIEEAIDWECDIIKFYAQKNLGVYKNIGLGAKKVFECEKRAIFLEDDNYPEITFFQYCDELLDRYENNKKVLWICGTNYLQEYKNSKNESYYFTQHLLPCGWASWSDKFIKYYNGELIDFNDKKKIFLNSYKMKSLAKQQWLSIQSEYSRKLNNKDFISWDYQMLFSIRTNNLVGIAPSKNQIKNIGVDNDSIHGGNSLSIEMTRRFCEIHTKTLDFPLTHPQKIYFDTEFNKKVAKVILYPLNIRLKNNLYIFIKKLMGIDQDQSFKEEMKNKIFKEGR